MACADLTAITKDCLNNLGGVKRLYILPVEDLNLDKIVTSANTDYGFNLTTLPAVPNIVDGIFLISGKKFTVYDLTKNTTVATDETPISLENGSTIYGQSLAVKFNRQDVAKRNSLALLASGQRDLVAIYQDANDIYWYLGATNGLNVTAMAGGSGTAKADGSNWTITLTGEEPELKYTVDPNIIAGLL